MWVLFVDTDFVYLESRCIYGSAARMDYLHLPFYIVQQATDISFFSKKMALVMRNGSNWQKFEQSLAKFSYDVILSDRGMQLHTVSSLLTKLVTTGYKLMLVTSAVRLDVNLVASLCDKGEVRVASFGVSSDILEVAGDNNLSKIHKIPVVHMTEKWLWQMEKRVEPIPTMSR